MMAVAPTFEIKVKRAPEWVRIRTVIDMMGTALVHHGHVWTDEERAAFEEAIAIIDRLIEVA